jgi:hypothetical protein
MTINHLRPPIKSSTALAQADANVRLLTPVNEDDNPSANQINTEAPNFVRHSEKIKNPPALADGVLASFSHLRITQSTARNTFG